MRKTTAFIVSSLGALLVFLLVGLGLPTLLGFLYAAYLVSNPEAISADTSATISGAIWIVCVLGGLVAMGYVGKKLNRKILGETV